jgi:hypothetical protein
MGRLEMHTMFQTENLKARDHLRDLGVDGRIILQRLLKRQTVKVGIGFTWLRTGTSGGLLQI